MLCVTREGVIVLTETLLTTQEAAERLGVTAKTIQNYVNSGELQAVATLQGKRRVLRFRPEVIDAFIQHLGEQFG